MGTQKNRLNETILLSNQNTCYNRWIRKYSQFTLKNFGDLHLCKTSKLQDTPNLGLWLWSHLHEELHRWTRINHLLRDSTCVMNKRNANEIVGCGKQCHKYNNAYISQYNEYKSPCWDENCQDLWNMAGVMRIGSTCISGQGTQGIQEQVIFNYLFKIGN